MKKFAILAALALLAAFGVKFALNLAGPSDAQMIKDALADSIKASREGRPGGVMDILSDKLKINDQEAGPRRQIADFIKSSHPDIEVVDPTPVVRAEAGTAQITSAVRLRVSVFGQKLDQTIPSVTLVFTREDARDWLILPVKKWRLTDVSVPIASIPVGLLGAGGAPGTTEP